MWIKYIPADDAARRRKLEAAELRAARRAARDAETQQRITSPDYQRRARARRVRRLYREGRLGCLTNSLRPKGD